MDQDQVCIGSSQQASSYYLVPNTVSLNSLWLLVPVRDAFMNYTIELTYGEVKPRLVASEGYGTTVLKASMDARDGYEDPNARNWVVEYTAPI